MEEQEQQQLREEKERLQASLVEVQSQFALLEEEKVQIQKCYDQAIQEVADSEAKRETVNKELRQAHSQIESMWVELKCLRQHLEESPSKQQTQPAHQDSRSERLSRDGEENDNSLTLTCGLCNQTISNQSGPTPTTPPTSPQSITHSETITSQQQPQPQSQPLSSDLSQNHSSQPQPLNKQEQQEQLQPSQQLQTTPKNSPKQTPKAKRGNWFGRKQNRMKELESHSKVCYSASQPTPRATPPPNSPNKKASTKTSPNFLRRSFRAPKSQNGSAQKGEESGEGLEYLVVNVTRSSHVGTDTAPFKVVTKTNLSTFSSHLMEVHRSQSDFQWLHAALQESCPERIVPPLRPPISLDATISEFQRFLSRVSAHKVLSKHNLFVTFLSSSSEELKALRTKHRPRNHGNKMRYKPVVGRDTSSGPLVDTKDYLTMLEQNLAGLSAHLEQGVRKGYGSPMERAAHWFRAIGDSEPDHTYLKKASTDLARTCESMEGQLRDGDEVLFIQNLQSLTDYIRVAQELLIRVEEAVDEYLYWDEELSIIESVNSNSDGTEDSNGVVGVVSSAACPEPVFDDSGVSDVASNSTNSTGGDVVPPDCHMVAKEGSQDSGSEVVLCATGERWANASKKCGDSKEFLEFMCANLTEELSLFDLHKEKELKQILLDYASAQLERHEKFQGKWFAIKFLLDAAISPDSRAIQFTPQATPTNGNDKSDASL